MGEFILDPSVFQKLCTEKSQVLQLIESYMQTFLKYDFFINFIPVKNIKFVFLHMYFKIFASLNFEK